MAARAAIVGGSGGGGGGGARGRRRRREVERVEQLAEALRALLPLGKVEVAHDLEAGRGEEAPGAPIDGPLPREHQQEVADRRVPAVRLGPDGLLAKGNLPEQVAVLEQVGPREVPVGDEARRRLLDRVGQMAVPHDLVVEVHHVVGQVAHVGDRQVGLVRRLADEHLGQPGKGGVGHRMQHGARRRDDLLGDRHERREQGQAARVGGAAGARSHRLELFRERRLLEQLVELDVGVGRAGGDCRRRRRRRVAPHGGGSRSARRALEVGGQEAEALGMPLEHHDVARRVEVEADHEALQPVERCARLQADRGHLGAHTQPAVHRLAGQRRAERRGLPRTLRADALQSLVHRRRLGRLVVVLVDLRALVRLLPVALVLVLVGLDCSEDMLKPRDEPRILVVRARHCTEAVERLSHHVRCRRAVLQVRSWNELAQEVADRVFADRLRGGGGGRRADGAPRLGRLGRLVLDSLVSLIGHRGRPAMRAPHGPARLAGRLRAGMLSEAPVCVAVLVAPSLLRVVRRLAARRVPRAHLVRVGGVHGVVGQPLVEPRLRDAFGDQPRDAAAQPLLARESQTVEPLLELLGLCVVLEASLLPRGRLEHLGAQIGAPQLLGLAPGRRLVLRHPRRLAVVRRRRRGRRLVRGPRGVWHRGDRRCDRAARRSEGVDGGRQPRRGERVVSRALLRSGRGGGGGGRGCGATAPLGSSALALGRFQLALLTDAGHFPRGIGLGKGLGYRLRRHLLQLALALPARARLHHVGRADARLGARAHPLGVERRDAQEGQRLVGALVVIAQRPALALLPLDEARLAHRARLEVQQAQQPRIRQVPELLGRLAEVLLQQERLVRRAALVVRPRARLRDAVRLDERPLAEAVLEALQIVAEARLGHVEDDDGHVFNRRAGRDRGHVAEAV